MTFRIYYFTIAAYSTNVYSHLRKTILQDNPCYSHCDPVLGKFLKRNHSVPRTRIDEVPWLIRNRRICDLWIEDIRDLPGQQSEPIMVRDSALDYKC